MLRRHVGNNLGKATLKGDEQTGYLKMMEPEGEGEKTKAMNEHDQEEWKVQVRKAHMCEMGTGRQDEWN